MATIFSDVLGFMKSAFRGAASTDFLRDYRHATELFVGNDFSLVPKSGYLFHVFFDINPYAAHSALLDTTRSTEIGMLVKSVDLPKFSIDFKTYNSYNKPNLVQSKIKYDQVNVSFRDDSQNLIRNFWYDYYSFYFADTLNPIETHRRNLKYNNESPYFGYRLRADLPDYNYLHAVRIYSLTHNQFSEYILVNPLITNFRHGTHDYESQESANMSHEMSINYEGVFYSEGYIEDGGVKGFATLHYDRIRSPLNRIGARRSIFGRGGLINTASSIIGDITRGNYLSAIFKFATARQTFKGVNLKKAAVNEVRQIFTTSATNAITGAITQQMRSTTPGGYNVVSGRSLPGAGAASGLEQIGSALALTGVAAILNSRSLTNKYSTNPVVQSNRSGVTGNYAPRFPTVPGSAIPTAAPSNILKANDTGVLIKDTNQRSIDIQQQRVNVNQAIINLENQLKILGQSASDTQKQINNLTLNITNLNNKLAQAKSAGASTDIIDGILQQISVAVIEKQNNEARLLTQRDEISSIRNQLNIKLAERNSING